MLSQNRYKWCQSGRHLLNTSSIYQSSVIAAALLIVRGSIFLCKYSNSNNIICRMFANKANDECKHCYVHRVLKIIGFDCRGVNFPTV